MCTRNKPKKSNPDEIWNHNVRPRYEIRVPPCANGTVVRVIGTKGGDQNVDVKNNHVKSPFASIRS